MFTLDPNAITEVICGYRGAATTDAIQNLLRRKEYEHITLKIAHPDQRVYRLRVEELPRSLWEYWYLDSLPGAPGPVTC
jgi:hypothetical protein